MNFQVMDIYRKPAAFGPTGVPMLTRWGGMSHTEANFLTEHDALMEIMPDNIELSSDVVHVYQNTYKKYSHNAGRAYNYFGIGLDAIFKTKDGQRIPGWYLPVCWMTDPISIVAGRDSRVAFPKLYGQINDPVEMHTGDGWDNLYCSVAEYGTKMIEIELHDLQDIPEERLREIQKGGFKGTWLLDGGPLPAYNRFDTFQVGRSVVKFNDVTWEQCPSAYYIINALKKLPVLSMEMGRHYTGCLEMSDQGELGEAERKGLLP